MNTISATPSRLPSAPALAVGALLTLVGCSDAPTATPGSPGTASEATGEPAPVLEPIDNGGGLSSDASAAADGVAYREPDPDGATALQRRGYPAALQQADDLVSVRYLDGYRRIAPRLRELAGELPIGATPLQTACPGGGDATVAQGNAGEPGQPLALRFTFQGCRIDGIRFDGQLQQQETLTGARFRNGTELATRFEALTLEDDAGLRLELDGTSTDTIASLANPTCGVLAATTRSHTAQFDTVSIDDPDAGRIDLASVRYSSRDDDGFGERDDCGRALRITFEGSVTATLADEPGGPVMLTLDKSGSLLREPTDDTPLEAEARLDVSASDNTVMNVSIEDDAAGLARFDLNVDGVAVSFVDEFRFER